MLTVSYGTAMSAAEQSLPAMRRMESYDRCQYRSGHGNTSLDFVTGLPRSKGFDAICVVVECLTKQRHLVPCTTTITAEGLVDLFAIGSSATTDYQRRSYPISGPNSHPPSGSTSVFVLRLIHASLPLSTLRLMDKPNG